MFHVEQIVLPVGEVRNRLIAGLFLGFGKIDALADQAGRGAGLKAAKFQANFLKRAGQAHRGRFPCPTAGLLVLADVHQAAQGKSRW